jgi:hypothetical protein
MILFNPAVATDCQAEKYEKIILLVLLAKKMQ